jgi:sec-independent protein translocase protein TatA
MMGRLGIGEIIFIGLAIVVLFGAKKLPEIGESLGKAIREFKKASKEIQNDVNEAVNDKNDVKRG